MKMCAKPMNWRLMVVESALPSNFSQGSISTSSLCFLEGFCGGLSDACVGFGVDNRRVQGSGVGMNQLNVVAVDKCRSRVILNERGILCHGMQTSKTLYKWIKIGKWLERDA